MSNSPCIAIIDYWRDVVTVADAPLVLVWANRSSAATIRLRWARMASAASLAAWRESPPTPSDDPLVPPRSRSPGRSSSFRTPACRGESIPRRRRRCGSSRLWRWRRARRDARLARRRPDALPRGKPRTRAPSRADHRPWPAAPPCWRFRPRPHGGCRGGPGLLERMRGDRLQKLGVVLLVLPVCLQSGQPFPAFGCEHTAVLAAYPLHQPLAIEVAQQPSRGRFADGQAGGIQGRGEARAAHGFVACRQLRQR